MFELYAKNLHFRGDSEADRCFDLCVHGEVCLRVDGVWLSDDTEWCVSASALRFLRSLFRDHFLGAEQHMIPCCGHFMIASEDGRSVLVSGCNNGIDFDVLHQKNDICIRTETGGEYTVPFAEYKTAVLGFAEQIETFYRQSPSRRFRPGKDDFERDGFEAFRNEWFTLMDAAASEHACTAPNISFDDYLVFCDADVANVSSYGISLKSGAFINFRECAYNYKHINGGDGRCVGDRDISGNPSFDFYTAPLVTSIVFLERRGALRNAQKRFRDLQKRIEKYGYTIVDFDVEK